MAVTVAEAIEAAERCKAQVMLGEARVIRGLLNDRSELLRALENLTEVSAGNSPARDHARDVLRNLRGY